MLTDMETELRSIVEEMVYNQQPNLIAFDGCHKIYASLSANQHDWFMDNSVDAGDEHGYIVFFSLDEDEMIQTLIDWWEGSCGLRFISTVGGNGTNADFNDVIPQFWEDKFHHFCEDCGIEVDEDEELCWDCENARNMVPCEDCGIDIEPGWIDVCDDCQAERDEQEDDEDF